MIESLIVLLVIILVLVVVGWGLGAICDARAHRRR